MNVERLAVEAAAAAGAVADALRALAPAGVSVSGTVSEIVAAVRARGDAGAARIRRALRRRHRPAARRAAASSTRALAAARPRGPRRPGGRDRQRARGRRGRAGRRRRRSTLPEGQSVTPPRAARAPRGDLRARRAQPVPVDGRHGRRHRTRRRRRGGRRLRAGRPPGRSSPPARCAAPTRSCAWAAPTRSPRSPTAPRASPRVDVIAGPGQPLRAGGQAAGVAATSASTASPGPPTCSSSPPATPTPSSSSSTCSPRPSTARARSCALVSDDAPLLDAVAERLDAEPDGDAAAAGRRGRRPRRRRWPSPRRFAPEHLELVGADAEALADRVRSAGCVFVGRESGTAFGDYVAGSNHTLPTGGAARFASGLSTRATSAGA